MKWYKSPAKINRFLFIKDRLENGYHEIITLFEKIEFFDTLGIELIDNSKGQIHLKCPDWLPTGPENLVYKAAKSFLDSTKKNFTIYIELEKNIPVGGGLGGGSSNCAITLKALNELSGFLLKEAELLNIAEKIGADCPFFIKKWVNALGTGTGTVLERVNVKPYYYVLILPELAVSTKWAYENFELTTRTYETIFEPRKGCLDEIWQNDLEKPVYIRYPILGELKEQLVKLGAKAALMSGSGSTVFGVFETKEDAQRAQKVLVQNTGFNCLVTKTLDQKHV